MPASSPTSGPTPTATYTAALAAMLVPGPPLPAPPNFYFLNGDDIWQQPSEGDARAVTSDLRIGPWAQTPDGTKAAMVIYGDIGGNATEELRVLQPDLTVSDPILVPSTSLDDAEAAAIQSLDWSWDGNALVVAFADGAATIVQNFQAGSAATTIIAVDAPVGGVADGPVLWAPSGAGVAYLVTDEEQRGSLYIAPTGDAARPVFSSAGQVRAARTFDWLAGRGRLIFVEQPNVSPAWTPGSIFTIAPDGTALELLVSSSQFAPAASVALIAPARDGRQVAFTVHVPNADGELVFQSLWIQTIDSGGMIELSVEPGYRVTDLWWSAAGLCWRGVDLGARGSATSAEYSGTEPFVLGRSNIDDGTSIVIFRSDPRSR